MMKALEPYGVDLNCSTLIEASAGTGKTYTIATLFCRLVAKGEPVESILVVTFTEAAAAELKLRIRQRLCDTLYKLEDHTDQTDRQGADDDELINAFKQGERRVICQRLALAITCFDQASILTIHSFCLKILKENAFDSQALFDIQLMPDRALFLNQVCADFFMSHVNHLDPLLLNYLATKNISPDYFISAFEPVVSRQHMAIVPEPKKVNLNLDMYWDIVQKIKKILETEKDIIQQLIEAHKGIDKRSYSKRYLSTWLDKSHSKIIESGPDTLFAMTEKGDPLYKFCFSRIASKTKTGHTPPAHPFFDLSQQLVDFTPIFEDMLMGLKHEFLRFFNSQLEKVKQSQGICFFDDLVNDLYYALNGIKSSQLIAQVRASYNACLIDEFQDTDPVQYEIFSKIFSHPQTAFFMIGDPKQAIYAFRGGDIFAYLKATQDSKQQFTLDKNYRSAPKLVKGINHLFSFTRNPFLFEKIAFLPVDTPKNSVDTLTLNAQSVAPVHILMLDRTPENTHKDGFISKKNARQMIPELTAKDILALLNSDYRLKGSTGSESKVICPSDIAVLVRTNAQAQHINRSLSMLDIPSYVSKSGSVYESDEAIDLYDILIAVRSPENSEYLKAALCTGVFNYTSQQLLDLGENQDRFYAWKERFMHYKLLWDEKGFVSMIMAVYHSDHAFLDSDSSINERSLTNYYHLAELISQASVFKDYTPDHLIQWYTRQFAKTFRDEAADELRLDSDKDAVAIVTIHKSKGLEYPVVYLPYMWEAPRGSSRENVLYHDPENRYRLTLDIGSAKLENAIELSVKEEQAEQRRLLYVALTRAAAMCKIIWGGIKDVHLSALGQILHPAGCKDDKAMGSDLQILQAQSSDTIWIDTRSLNMDQKISQFKLTSRACQGNLSARDLNHDFYPQWKMSSFSSLVKSSHPQLSPGSTLPGINAQSKPAVTLSEFPKGPRAGDCFHLIFESIDFSQTIENAKAQVLSIFDQSGFGDPAFVNPGLKAVSQILNTRLETEKNGFCLCDIKSEFRLNEMEFVFPVERFSIKLFLDALKLSSEQFESSGYVHSLSQIQFSEFNGYLKGFIDLIIQHQGRWYIIDYKSNFLGHTYDEYSPDNIYAAMADHHYFLQYHIYLVALHRYLKKRIKDYNYKDHFGGVFYLFIRGMHPDYHSRYGVFFDRPSEQSICLLSDNL